MIQIDERSNILSLWQLSEEGELRLLLKDNEEFKLKKDGNYVSVFAPGEIVESVEPSLCCIITKDERSVLSLFPLPTSVESYDRDEPLLTLNQAHVLESLHQDYLNQGF